ncbi:Uma2 family endonuclease [Streptomyces hypolithicus]
MTRPRRQGRAGPDSDTRRRAIAAEALGRVVSDALTPRGLGDRGLGLDDWLTPETLYAQICDSVRGQVHLFSATDEILTTAPHDADRTWFAPEDIQLVIQVVSPESAHRDRTVRLRKYAEAGIRHYWCIEDENTVPPVHDYELDAPTGSYAPAGIYRHALRRPLPFEISLDLDKLAPGRPG